MVTMEWNNDHMVRCSCEELLSPRAEVGIHYSVLETKSVPR